VCYVHVCVCVCGWVGGCCVCVHFACVMYTYIRFLYICAVDLTPPHAHTHIHTHMHTHTPTQFNPNVSKNNIPSLTHTPTHLPPILPPSSPSTILPSRHLSVSSPLPLSLAHTSAGERSTHFGEFPCGPAPPAVGAGESGPGGCGPAGCC